MKPPLQVVCGILRDDRKLALFQRKFSDLEVGDQWEFPGGKVEGGESHPEAITRELREELGIEVLSPNYVGSVYWQYPSLSLDLHALEISNWKGDIRLHEHQDYRWIAEGGLNYSEMAAADRFLAKKLKL